MHSAVPTTLACLLFAALPGCFDFYAVPASAWKTRQLPVAFPATPLTELEVQFYSGTLILEPGPVLDCSLRVDLTAPSNDELAALEGQLEPRLQTEPNGHATLGVGLPQGAPLDAITTFYHLRAPRSVKVVVRTLSGTVHIRGFQGDVEINGGSGAIDARLDGGRAVLNSTTGGIQLRGLFQIADVQSQWGRIDVQMPSSPVLALDLVVKGGKGEVFFDLQDGERLDLRYRGETALVRPEPEVRLEWERVSIDEFHIGRMGEVDGLPAGSVQLVSEGRVNVRLSPAGSGTW